MAIYAISDLHLAKSIDKPMDIFGDRWMNYMHKLEEGWNRVVEPNDTVIIPGDISWATYLDQAWADFQFIHQLPGKKLISKGNHDFWWTTQSKLDKFITKHQFNSIQFMRNNAIGIEDSIICGTRGWICPGEDEFSAEDGKIYKRELLRLDMSLKEAKKIRTDQNMIVALHYPPFNAKRQPSEFVEIMESFEVNLCIYGHLHGEGMKNAFVGTFNNIHYKMVSSDYLEFVPMKVGKQV